MYFGSSKDSIGIQLADLCGYFIANILRAMQLAKGSTTFSNDHTTTVLGGDPNNDPIAWNLSSGLDELTFAVQDDLQNIQTQLNRIIQLLQRAG